MRTHITLTYPIWELREIPEEVADLAVKRTQHLHALTQRRTLSELLRDAYLQGLTDVGSIWNGKQVEPGTKI